MSPYRCVGVSIEETDGMIKIVGPKFNVSASTNELSTDAVGNYTMGMLNRTKLVTALRTSRTEFETMTFK